METSCCRRRARVMDLFVSSLPGFVWLLYKIYYIFWAKQEAASAFLVASEIFYIIENVEFVMSTLYVVLEASGGRAIGSRQSQVKGEHRRCELW